MCGIIGVHSLNSSSLNNLDARFQKAIEMLHHRGPDGFNSKNLNTTLLGHTRLKILDLSNASEQPMCSEDRRYSLTYNGEIYNFKELKLFLESKYNLNFKTSGDTEILFQGLIHEGMNFLDRCNGMFAFCFVDSETNTLILARDRFGIKPLYYTIQDKKLFFSSEIPPILSMLDNKPSLNIESVSSYMSFRYPIQNNSFFNGVESLKPGHFLKIENGEVKETKFYDFIDKFEYQEEDKGEDYYLQNTIEKLENAVKLRMRSDVPYGAFLSGGVDSSFVTALMSKNSADKSVKTYNIGFKEEGYNEKSEADITANQYKTQHTYIEMENNDYFSLMDKLINIKGMPLSVPNEIPLYVMSKRLKEDITVVLSGEGADEIFMGYGRIFRSPHEYRLAQDNNSAILNNLKAKGFKEEHLNRELDFFYQNYCYTKPSQKSDIFNKDIQLNSYENNLKECFNEFFDNDLSFENKISYTFSKKHLPGLLQRVDNSTMATSIEGRVPFVDHELVEFAAKIPLKYKLKWNAENDDRNNLTSTEISEHLDTPKYILKKAGEGYISNEILYRKKKGFPVPLHFWLGGENLKLAQEILLDDSSKRLGLWNHDYIEKYLTAENISKSHANGLKIWMMMNFNIFHNTFFK